MLHLAYYDECGDDGFPERSSDYFVLTAIYLRYEVWQTIFDNLLAFRRRLKVSYGIPVRLEFHTNGFLKKAKPFTGFNLSNQDRLEIIRDYCTLLSQQDWRIVNICIAKTRIQNLRYQVLDTALTYSIQRIENDLRRGYNDAARFMILTDEGRVGSMRKTARRLKRINYVPSMYGSAQRRQDIQTLIEDPLPKDSAQSYFIQAADLVSFLVYLYCCEKHRCYNLVRKRIRSYVAPQEVSDWMTRLRPVLNTAAATEDPYGIKIHPG